MLVRHLCATSINTVYCLQEKPLIGTKNVPHNYSNAKVLIYINIQVYTTNWNKLINWNDSEEHIWFQLGISSILYFNFAEISSYYRF